MARLTVQHTPYNLNVTVGEVNLAFHEADAHDLPLNNLRLDELNLVAPPGIGTGAS
jgi:hypothetical protein